jgi:hypothetical protein
MSCGVTVVREVRKERTQNRGKEWVRHRPILGSRKGDAVSTRIYFNKGVD